jgi:sugar/nucleoside kinase (ribokinase family)
VIYLPGQIVFVGHTSVDHIRNLNGERCQPGGAALYAAMGARTICSDVGILTAVGNDYPFGEAFGDFEVTWVKKSKGPSTEFLITYDDAWNASYRNVSIGPGSKITTKDVLEVSKDGAKVIHLAPMNPPKVVKMVKSLRANGRDVIISINSNINYMGGKSNRRAILEAASLSDIFILNNRELHALTGIDVVSKAIKSISAKMLVLTLGEIGTLVSTSEGTEFIPALAAITKNVVDATGAGDAWAGSFLASYRKSNSWIKAVSFASVISAIKCTGWNFEKIRSIRFENVEDVFDWAITRKEKWRQLTLSDALGAGKKL